MTCSSYSGVIHTFGGVFLMSSMGVVIVIFFQIFCVYHFGVLSITIYVVSCVEDFRVYEYTNLRLSESSSPSELSICRFLTLGATVIKMSAIYFSSCVC